MRSTSPLLQFELSRLARLPSVREHLPPPSPTTRTSRHRALRLSYSTATTRDRLSKHFPSTHHRRVILTPTIASLLPHSSVHTVQQVVSLWDMTKNRAARQPGWAKHGRNAAGRGGRNLFAPLEHGSGDGKTIWRCLPIPSHIYARSPSGSTSNGVSVVISIIHLLVTSF